MEQLILAVGECDPANDIICRPENVIELFEFSDPLFTIGPLGFTRTVILIFLAMIIVVALLFFGLRGKGLVPSKFGVAIESLVVFVRDEIAIGIIGPEGIKYFPWLLSIFLFILVGNAFEVLPLINFPITSRMAIPLGLSLLTWVIFVFVGFKKNGSPLRHGSRMADVGAAGLAPAGRPDRGRVDVHPSPDHARRSTLRQLGRRSPHADAAARLRMGVHRPASAISDSGR